MIPIYMHGPEGNRGHMFNEFSRNLLRICAEHHARDRACAFAFIVYDMANPWVYQVLDDPKFFVALDRVSGNVLSVFSIHEGQIHGGTWNHDNALRAAAGIDGGSKEILDRYFGLLALRPPAVLFFQVVEERVDRYVSFELSAGSRDEAFNELHRILDVCAKCMRDSVGNAIRDPNLAFDRLQGEVAKQKVGRTIASILRRATSIKDAIGIFDR